MQFEESLFEEYERETRYLNGIFSDSSDSSDENDGTRRNRELLQSFYELRKDIFELFDDEKIRKTFRFDKESILYLSGIYQTFSRSTRVLTHTF
jgi:hypothetical protein